MQSQPQETYRALSNNLGTETDLYRDNRQAVFKHSNGLIEDLLPLAMSSLVQINLGTFLNI